MAWIPERDERDAAWLAFVALRGLGHLRVGVDSGPVAAAHAAGWFTELPLGISKESALITRMESDPQDFARAYNSFGVDLFWHPPDAEAPASAHPDELERLLARVHGM